MKDVGFAYPGLPLFADFRIAVAEREFFGVIGPNGSGKTTLLKLMAGLLAPLSGDVVVKGKGLSDYSRRNLARVLGFMPQENHFAFDFSVQEVVMMGRNPYLGRFQRPGKQDRERVQAAMEFADVWLLREKRISQVSGGEKQRVVLARTLAQEPEILLLDEPASQLDLGHLLQMLSILRRLNQQGITIVLLSHDLNLASVACSRILLLDRGKAVACDTPARVLVPELVEQVYGVRPLLERHPQTGTPQVVLPV